MMRGRRTSSQPSRYVIRTRECDKQATQRALMDRPGATQDYRRSSKFQAQSEVVRDLGLMQTNMRFRYHHTTMRATSSRFLKQRKCGGVVGCPSASRSSRKMYWYWCRYKWLSDGVWCKEVAGCF